MEEAETPPYWQPTATLTRRNTRRRPILHSSLVIIIVPSLSLLFIVFFLLPSIPRFIPQPNSPLKLNSKAVSVKKSWDTLNIVLVVFAILCGVFARRNDDVSTQEERSNGGSSEEARRSKSERRSAGSTPQWGGYAEQRIFHSPPSTPVNGVSRLRRTVSEMPPSQWATGNDRLRFCDDFDVNKFYQSHPNHALHHYYHHHHYPSFYPEVNQIEPEINQVEPGITLTEPEIVPEADGGSVEEIPVETFVLQTRDKSPSPTLSPPRENATHAPLTPPKPPPPPPPPPPSPLPRRARTFQSIPSKTRAPTVPPPPPPPPPPRPPPSPAAWGEKRKRSSRNRMNATKEIASAIASLYSTHRKRKRKQKSSKQSLNYEEDPSSLVAETPPPPTPPPPSPPPPPASVFHSLFRKGGKTKTKSKKVHSLSSSTNEPPPPPTPPTRPSNSSGKPPLPGIPVHNLFEREDGIPFSGSQSPVTPIPPPPMRLGRHDRMRRGTREPEVDGSRSQEMKGRNEERGCLPTATACPSPDVNAKADTFIARLHDGWRLEKLNSWREKHTDGAGGGGRAQYEGFSN